MMERSSKFISLSGLSGILAGIYALIGAGLAYQIIYDGQNTFASSYAGNGGFSVIVNILGFAQLFSIALVVLLASLITCIILTIQKANRKGQQVWGSVSKQVLFNMAVPLIAGGLLVLILFSHGYYWVVAPSLLIFYGLALVNVSNFTFNDVRYLGICEIVLGLLAALLPVYGLLFWAIGFGVLHIIYGSIMYFKYDK
jgi:hypothetical protein